jgi:hypothetical protein
MFDDAVLDRIISDVCWNHIAMFMAEPFAKLSSDQREKIMEITESYPSVAFGNVEELQDKIPSGELPYLAAQNFLQSPYHSKRHVHAPVSRQGCCAKFSGSAPPDHSRSLLAQPATKLPALQARGPGAQPKNCLERKQLPRRFRQYSVWQYGNCRFPRELLRLCYPVSAPRGSIR